VTKRVRRELWQARATCHALHGLVPHLARQRLASIQRRTARGARRLRASKIAKRESIPATVRELTDAQALELQVIELPVVRKSFLW
jgi:ParB-like nuclease domain